MNSIDLKYNFHDATIVSCYHEKKDEFMLKVQLYKIFYSSTKLIQLTFTGIYNAEKTHKLISQVCADGLEPHWNGTRINSIQVDKKNTPRDLHLYVWVHIDGYRPLKVHCQKIQLKEIAHDG
ncbi:MAG: hypothetical protein AAF206_10220 [Bacteroidota bacterium]